MSESKSQAESSFVVTAYRWGLRDAHSYVVAASRDSDSAIKAAKEHFEARGGKYGIEVVMCGDRLDELGEAIVKSQVYYIESSYFTLAGRGDPASHPADISKSPLVNLLKPPHVEFEGMASGDCECFCWDKVPLDTCEKLNPQPEWIKNDPEALELETPGRLYPNDIMRNLGVEDEKMYVFKISASPILEEKK